MRSAPSTAIDRNLRFGSHPLLRFSPPLTLFFSVVLCAVPLWRPLDAASPLSYSAVESRFVSLWNRKFPLPCKKVVANPEKKGVLRATVKGKWVYYYQFRVTVARPIRKEDESIDYTGERTMEVWIRYRPDQHEEPFDFTFARRDMLPGKNKRWIKIGK